MIRVALLSLIWFSGAPCVGSELSQRLEGLLAERNYAELDALCGEMFSPHTATADRLDLATIWLRSCSQRMLSGSPNEKADALHIADRLGQGGIDALAQSERGVLVRIEFALYRLAAGESLLANSSDRDAGRNALRDGLEFLEAAAKEFDQLLLGGYAMTPRERADWDWTIAELESARRNVKLQLARGYRGVGMSYATGSANRINALTLALEQVGDLANLPDDAETAWRARLEQLACLGAMGRFARSHELLAAWKQEAPPARFAEQLKNAELNLAALEHHAERAADPLREKAAALIATGEASPDTSRQLRQLALENSHRDSAATIHFQAICTLAKCQQNGHADLIVEYEALLLEHIKLWPQGDESIVRWWLVKLYAGQQRWAEAYEALDLDGESPGKFSKADEYLLALILLHHGSGDALRLFVHDAENYTQEEINAVAPALVDGARRLVSDSPEEARGFLAWVDLLEMHEAFSLDHSAKIEIAHLKGEIYESLDERQQALRWYNEWRTLAPDDGAAHETYARLVSDSTLRRYLEEGLGDWTALEKRCEPGGERWTRARRARIELLRKLGDDQQAAKLLRVTKVLYPGFE